MSEQSDPQRWLRYARDDLAAARTLLSDDSLPGRLACFHAHQAAEKALKASLVAAGIEFRKTHDLVVLAELQPEPLRSAVLALDVERVQPWAVDARYPADAPEVSPEEAGDVVGVASRLVDLVADALAAGTDRRRPPSTRVFTSGPAPPRR